MSLSGFWTYSIILTLIIVSCKRDDCGEITFEDQYLENESFSYQSWKGVQSFIYTDSLGEEFSYTLSDSIEILLNSLNTGFCEDTTRYITFHTEYFLRRFVSPEETAIAFAQFVDFVEQEQDLKEDRLVDKMGLSIFNDSIPSPDPISRIVLMTAERQSPYDQDQYNMGTSVQHDSLTIMGKTFYDVFEQKVGSPKLYYTKADGIVSFTDIKGRHLVLDRVE